MSAYIVSHNTIRRLLDGLTYLQRAGYPLAEEFARIGDPTEIGQQLLRLNEEAVYQRYTKDRATMAMGSADADLFTYSPKATPILQAMKSAACLLYQCSEGTVPDDSDLYRLLDALVNALARCIVQALPEYEKATWG